MQQYTEDCKTILKHFLSSLKNTYNALWVCFQKLLWIKKFKGTHPTLYSSPYLLRVTS